MDKGQDRIDIMKVTLSFPKKEENNRNMSKLAPRKTSFPTDTNETNKQTKSKEGKRERDCNLLC